MEPGVKVKKQGRGSRSIPRRKKETPYQSALSSTPFGNQTNCKHALFLILILFINSFYFSFPRRLDFTTYVHADVSSHEYKEGETVTLFFGKTGPFHNPSEVYAYNTLPFCKPSEAESPKEEHIAGIGDLLEGHALVNSGFHIYFKKNTPKTVLCTQTLTDEDVEIFKYAISNHYWFQCYLDDLPIWGMIGEIVGTEEDLKELESRGEIHHAPRDAYIYTSKRLDVSYNGNRIIEVNLTSEDPVEVKSGVNLEFAYQVDWKPTTKAFEDRWNRYLDLSFFEHQIHWFSIFNSFMMVVFLCGLVSLILMRTLRHDYARYDNDNDGIDGALGGEVGFGDDSGWKQVHGDVFRRPSHVALLSVFFGIGVQLLFLILGVIISAIAGSLFLNRGSLVTAVLVWYAITSGVAGYASGSLYKQFFYPNPAQQWIRVMVLTAFLIPGILITVTACLGMIGMYYSTISVLPFRTFLTLFAVFITVVCPMVVFGTILGRNWSGEANHPCRVNALPRPIPPREWYNMRAVMIPITGILPFGAIFIEIFFLMSSLWQFKFFYVYGFLFLVFLILIIVSACVTVVSTYFLLNSEDWRWHWYSFLASASTAGWVWLYSIYYFVFKTRMTGFLQSSYYFAYMTVFCFGLGLLTGSIGFYAAKVFVGRIYQAIKVA